MKLRRTPYGYVHPNGWVIRPNGWVIRPNGWVIRRWKREWSERVGAMRGASLASPLIVWEIHRFARHPPRVVTSFGTLRDARAWCDEHDAVPPS